MTFICNIQTFYTVHCKSYMLLLFMNMLIALNIYFPTEGYAVIVIAKNSQCRG